MDLQGRQLQAKLMNWFYPGYSRCGLCNRNWKICEGHTTYFEPGSGCFPLCEDCWKELTPEERLPYYETLWKQWMYDGQMEEAEKNGVITKKKLRQYLKDTKKIWPLIKKAVLEGK